MKYLRVFRILGLAVILSLMIVAMPAAPALAAYDMLASPTQGKIGDTISITGTNFPATIDPASPVTIIIYFSNQSALAGQYIGTTVTKYKTIASPTTSSTGTFVRTFTIPSKYNDNTNVTSGTHYLYACLYTAPTTILNYTTITVSGGEISISPTTGLVDTPVDITGSAFVPSTTITVKYDGATIIIEGGNVTTDTSGDFTSTIYVPESTAGTHTISVVVGTSEETATFTVEPEITLWPQSGKAGTQVTVTGTGFVRRPQVSFYFNNQLMKEILAFSSDTKGSFTATVTIPSGLSARVYTLEADDGENVADASFTLTVPPQPEPTPEPEPTPPPTTPEPTPTQPEASLDISAGGDAVGTLIGIGGTGFTPNGKVTVKYDDTEIATTTADENGFFLVTFQAPASQHGAHKITASDNGTNSAETTFTVESKAPETPPPQLPEMGVKVKSPISLDWGDVTDESLPVTYELQIATAATFSANSIVLDLKGIEISAYILSEAEELRLAGQKTPYYWRIRAVDAASNASEWTGAGEFYVAAPFSFTGWPLYTLLGIGAVFIFGIGYWLGRRTAFYY
jgi:hypothetical protein